MTASTRPLGEAARFLCCWMYYLSSALGFWCEMAACFKKWKWRNIFLLGSNIRKSIRTNLYWRRHWSWNKGPQKLCSSIIVLTAVLAMYWKIRDMQREPDSSYLNRQLLSSMACNKVSPSDTFIFHYFHDHIKPFGIAALITHTQIYYWPNWLFQ